MKAATRTWDGSSSNLWNLAANWAENAVPTTGDALVFPSGAANISTSNDIAASTSFASITFNSGASAYTLAGNALILSGGAAAIAANNTSLTMTISLNITFSTAAPTIAVASGGTLTISGTIANGGYLITTSCTGSIKFSGIVSGTGGITKTGDGNFELSATNTYSGTTTASDGLTLAKNGSALGATSGGTVVSSGGGLVVYTGYTYVAEPLTLNGTGDGVTAGALRISTATAASSTITFPGAITLASNSSIGVSVASATFVLSGIISGGFALEKADVGILKLSGVNTYTGATTITAGTLQLGAAGVITDASAVTITGTLDMNTFSETVGSIAGAGTINNVAGAGTPTLTCGGDNSSTTFSGTIQNTSGTLSLTKAGAGALTLSGASTYTGTTTISAGTILIGAAVAVSTNSPVGNATSAIVLGDANTTTNNSTPQLKLNGAYTFARPITISSQTTSGWYYIGGNTDNNATFSGLITYSHDFSIEQVATTGGRALTISGGITTGAAGTIICYFGNTGDLNVTTTAISDGVGTAKIGKSGTGTTTFSVASTYTGQTFVTAGTLKAGVATTAFGSNAWMYLGNVAGVTLDITGYSNTIGSLSEGGTTGGNVTLGAATLTIGGDNSWRSYAGVISGTGAITKTGSGGLTLSNSNTYTGATTVSAGYLVLNANYASPSYAISSGAFLTLAPTGANIDYGVNTSFSGAGTIQKTGSYNVTWGTVAATFAMTSGALIDVQAGTFVGGSYANEVYTNNYADLTVASGAAFYGSEANVKVDALSGAGNIYSGYSGSGYVNFTFGVDNGTGTFTGVITDATAAGNFVKSGTGTQRLSGANTYTGTTTISAGTLQLGAAARISNSSNVVMSGGYLSTGSGAGYAETVGTLTLTAHSRIVLGTGSHSLNLAASNGTTWTAATLLRITGWQGSWNSTTGTSGKIYTGSSAELSAGKLAQIFFTHPISGMPYTAIQLGTGEVVPTSTLPVKLVSFTGEKGKNFNELFWITASEINSEYFEVMRSSDGVNFESIGKVNAAGNSSDILQYTFVDYEQPSGTNYYQLKQFDYDGQNETFNIVAIANTSSEFKMNALFPNPANASITVNFQSTESGSHFIFINDAQGNEIFTATIATLQGDNKFILPTQNYASGTYFVRIVSPKKEGISSQIVVQY